MDTLYDIVNTLTPTTLIKDKCGGLWNKFSFLPFFPKEQLGTPATITTGNDFRTITLETGQSYQVFDLMAIMNINNKSY